jgi:hypothetical protein
MNKFDAAPIAVFLMVAGAGAALLSVALLTVDHRLWKYALTVPVLGALLALLRGTRPGPLRVNLLFSAIILASTAVALLTARRALRAGYEPQMKAQFMRALTRAEQLRFTAVLGTVTLGLSTIAIAACIVLL